MAAKPPKPPGNLMKFVSTPNNNNNNSNSNSDTNENNLQSPALSVAGESKSCALQPSKVATNCNCRNIAIMHLFHEMKQEFPTLPDTVVAQCVNENCHQRENCIQMLRQELELNPIPAQTYPAKVLHPSIANSTTTSAHSPSRPVVQQKPQTLQKPPVKPLKPIRPAPLQPSFPPPPPPPSLPLKKPPKNVQITKNKVDKEKALKATNNHGNDNIASADIKDGQTNLSINVGSPSKILDFVSNQDCPATGANPMEELPVPPRIRPTTLNLNSDQQQLRQQQEQRQLLNIQLQQQFQQQRHKNLQPSINNGRPLRKAPLPPIAPKPSNISNNIKQFHQHPLINNNGNVSLNLNSPLSETELSVNVSLSTPSPTPPPTQQTTPTHHQRQLSANKSPIRHRSVINVQPEPPYSRDFFVTTSATTANTKTPINSDCIGNSADCFIHTPRSFTSVNLTLRQPTVSGESESNTVPQPSTIDISAGPGLSGSTGSGLTYSSTSYDARRRCQKNFHITVTDEGSVFRASRLSPRTPQNQQLQQQQHLLQQQQQQEQHQQFHNCSVNKKKSEENRGDIQRSEEMCQPPQQAEDDFLAEVLQRQKKKRDKLAAVLRENKRRLNQVKEEINVLTEPVEPGFSEMLENDVKRLRIECQAMLNEIENVRRCSGDNNSYFSQHQQLSTQSQSFPRQRFNRPPATRPQSPSHQTSLDFIQHHSSTSTSRPSAQHHNHNHMSSAIGSQSILLPETHQCFHHSPYLHDEEIYSDSEATGGADDDDDEDEQLEQWACDMCTFRNHALLNICESCESVRILPGTLTNFSRPITNAAASSNALNNPTAMTGSLEHDANLAQQQLQQFALHT
ncbi:myb-like protein AA isoform X2 [Glossina fuscipes]|uniref:Myb-like protein AA isoform X2 n=1 Tax=Glossina fuscipes TaxID=7396 RepID=A0A9C5Z011_9MUSC|nr:myb-like protein AA isoform X2 [Glossina fuscipes]